MTDGLSPLISRAATMRRIRKACYDRFRDTRAYRRSHRGNGGPYIMVPLDQLGAVEAVLRNNRIGYWVDSDAISLDGKPAVIVINLGRGANAAPIQQLLDAVN